MPHVTVKLWPGRPEETKSWQKEVYEKDIRNKNTLYRMPDYDYPPLRKGIVIAFPGMGYTCQEKLIAACLGKYRSQGYEIVTLDFSEIPFKELGGYQKAFEQAKKAVLQQVKEIHFQEYADVVFLSKSFGTICAGWLAQQLAIFPRHLFLTPLPETLPFVKEDTKVTAMVIGTEDGFMDPEQLSVFCARQAIPCLVVKGVGHSLKNHEDAARTEEINRMIVGLCQMVRI